MSVAIATALPAHAEILDPVMYFDGPRESADYRASQEIFFRLSYAEDVAKIRPSSGAFALKNRCIFSAEVCRCIKISSGTLNEWTNHFIRSFIIGLGNGGGSTELLPFADRNIWLGVCLSH